MNRVKRSFAGIVFTCAMALGAAASGQASYDITDLGTLGGNQSAATSINNNGVIAGWSSNGLVNHAFIWNNGVMTDISPAGTTAFGNSINDNGDVVGDFHPTFPAPGYNTDHAFLYQNGTTTDLGTLGGTTSHAKAINNSGQIVGDARTPSDSIHPYLYSSGVMTDILNATGFAYGINNTGQVVGSNRFLYDNGNVTHPGGSSGNNMSINGAGQICGEFGTTVLHAFIYSNGVTTDLGTLGLTRSDAVAINANGDAVGTAFTSSANDGVAFIYTQGVMHDLNYMITPGSGWNLFYAHDINDSGWIVGEGTHNGASHAFLLTPTPEPAGCLLIGAMGVAVMRRRRSV